MSQCASFFPPGAKWGLACVIQLSSHLKAFCLLIMFLLECWKTVHFFVWYLMLILACFCLDQKNMMIPFPCVCVYTSGGQSWHQVLFPITSPPLYFEASFLTEPRTHPFYFSAGQQVQSSPASPFPREIYTSVLTHPAFTWVLAIAFRALHLCLHYALYQPRSLPKTSPIVFFKCK